MKKCLSVMVVLCLLMSVVMAVSAEVAVYQDGMAPELVMVSDGQGGEAAALILDAEGNVIAVIPTDDMIKRICVGEREDILDADVAALLEKGLASLMNADNRTLDPKSVNTDIFYVEIPEEYAAYFEDNGACLDMVFMPQILDEAEEIRVLHSVDGEAWNKVSNVSFPSDETIQVGIQQSGLLAFVVEHAVVFGGDGSGEGVQEEASADNEAETNENFTPSVSGKLAPEVVPVEDEGEPCDAVIVDGDKEKVAAVPAKQWVVVTPLSERTQSPDVVTYEHLQWAYEAICGAQDIGDLPGEEPDSTLSEDIDRILADSGLSRADMTISDLFKIVVYGDYLQLLEANEDNVLEITFNKEVNPGDKLIVLCSSKVGCWHVMDEENVIINGGGTVTLRMKHDGVVAFLVEKANFTVDADAADVVTAP